MEQGLCYIGMIVGIIAVFGVVALCLIVGCMRNIYSATMRAGERRKDKNEVTTRQLLDETREVHNGMMKVLGRRK